MQWASKVVTRPRPRKERGASAPLVTDSSLQWRIWVFSVFVLLNLMLPSKKTNQLSRTPNSLSSWRGFLLERRVRAACFSRPHRDHRHRRPLHVWIEG
ncbi:hypothetical protein Y032_0098g3121 [Ancylostoma ceylanicum]|uniref:Uncharacterized protein n=1 Tax=Ancylostoma ceylanicum TaxID=53326 RepID=A0A016TJA3_9BILA|nr:hypothetical protein Y032_0098g3121 [Ancylostoma ceylanicum]